MILLTVGGIKDARKCIKRARKMKATQTHDFLVIVKPQKVVELTIAAKVQSYRLLYFH